MSNTNEISLSISYPHDENNTNLTDLNASIIKDDFNTIKIPSLSQLDIYNSEIQSFKENNLYHEQNNVHSINNPLWTNIHNNILNNVISPTFTDTSNINRHYSRLSSELSSSSSSSTINYNSSFRSLLSTDSYILNNEINNNMVLNKYSNENNYSHINPIQLTAFEKRKNAEIRKKLKNRERVRRCRKKKQDEMNHIEEKNILLERENAELRLQLSLHGKYNINESEIKSINEIHMNILENMVATLVESDLNILKEKAQTIWNTNATILYDNGWLQNNGLEQISQFHISMRQILNQFNVTDYSIQYDNDSIQRTRIKWEIEGMIHANNIKFFNTNEYTDLIQYIINMLKLLDKKHLKISGYSIISFRYGKIDSDLRIIDYFALLNEIQMLLPNTFNIIDFISKISQFK